MVVLSKTSLDMSRQIWCEELSVILDIKPENLQVHSKLQKFLQLTCLYNVFQSFLQAAPIHCSREGPALSTSDSATQKFPTPDAVPVWVRDVLQGMPFARNMTSPNLENSIHVMPRSINCFCSWFSFEPEQELKWWDERWWTSLKFTGMWEIVLWQMVRYGQPFMWNVTAWMWYDSGVHTWLSRLSRAVHDSTRAAGTPWIVLYKIHVSFLFWPFFFHSALSYIR